MLVVHRDQTATVLQDGRVLLLGGRTTSTIAPISRIRVLSVSSDAELYDPATDSWQSIGDQTAS